MKVNYVNRVDTRHAPEIIGSFQKHITVYLTQFQHFKGNSSHSMYAWCSNFSKLYVYVKCICFTFDIK